jgi:hypothetical protein
MTPGLILGALMSVCWPDRCIETQQISLHECRMEKDHLAVHNKHLRLQCAFRSEQPVEIDYD